ncbi:hypothetical protein BKA70DRAFT_1578683 [Coprinopsis sp. MPI-PUGE-AT-0042]|nr:hypothetical protein BKA70DRAFT_1578683 [Coprinopsis sp. MPI-PUGE-AT-0042]
MEIISSISTHSARNGDLLAMEQLIHSINPSNFSINVLEAFLGHLQSSSPQMSSGRHSSSNVRLMSKAVTGIDVCAKNCGGTPELKGSTVERLLDRFPDIVSCALCLSGESIWLLFSMLLSLQELDPQLEARVFSSPELCKIFLRVWNNPVDEDKREAEKLGLLIPLFTSFAWHDKGSLLIDALSSSPKQLARFTKGAIRIVLALHEAHLSLHEYADYLLSRLGGGIRFLLVRNWYIAAGLERHGFHRRWVEAVVSRHRKASPENLATIMDITLDIIDDPRLMIEAIEAGYLLAVVDAFIRVPKRDPARNSVVRANLARVQIFCSFPRFVKAIHPALLAALAQADAHRETEDLRKLEEKLALTSARHTLLIGFTGINNPGCMPVASHCDNDAHDFNGTEHVLLPPKICTGCHSIAYCSKRCQEQDWRARHRGECGAMGVAYNERKRRGVSYSLTTLTFQKAIAVEIFNLHHHRVEAERRRAYRKRRAHEFLAKYNTVHDAETSEGYCLVPFEEVALYRGDCAPSDARYEHLLNTFTEAGKANTILMNMFICWRGSLHSEFLLELESTAANNCLVRRSVHRFLCK